jgi:hypothetical protein
MKKTLFIALPLMSLIASPSVFAMGTQSPNRVFVTQQMNVTVIESTEITPLLVPSSSPPTEIIEQYPIMITPKKAKEMGLKVDQQFTIRDSVNFDNLMAKSDQKVLKNGAKYYTLSVFSLGNMDNYLANLTTYSV